MSSVKENSIEIKSEHPELGLTSLPMSTDYTQTNAETEAPWHPPQAESSLGSSDAKPAILIMGALALFVGLTRYFDKHYRR